MDCFDLIDSLLVMLGILLWHIVTDALSSQIKYFPAGHTVFNFLHKELFENVSLVVEAVDRIPYPLQCHSSSHNYVVNRKQAVSGINRNK